MVNIIVLVVIYHCVAGDRALDNNKGITGPKKMALRWCRSRQNRVAIPLILLGCMSYYVFLYQKLAAVSFQEYVITDRHIERNLADALKKDTGSGCDLPEIDPYDPEVMDFNTKIDKIRCDGFDWVRCHLSQCRVRQEILDTKHDILCSYRDIIHVSDTRHKLGHSVILAGDRVYELKGSDHVKISCTANTIEHMLPEKWSGRGIGFRSTTNRKKPPPGRNDTLNVLIFGFDSTSKHSFIRNMPKSWQMLADMNAVVLDGYNIVGDGTPAALFPILTGRTELELPDVRRSVTDTATLDDFPFLFYDLKNDGYRTLYFEDMPSLGTFQFRFNGFNRQPADHYLRSFLKETTNNGIPQKNAKYCIGDTPSYLLMMNKTKEFFEQDGKKFAFTFVADITHSDASLISTADDDTTDLLRWVRDSGILENTLVILFSDHGNRYVPVRRTYIGKLEERLPIMAILLPERLKRDKAIHANLLHNAGVLTTPHDIYATLLHALGRKADWNKYRVPGASANRGLTLFEPISKNRSCSEAGVEAHWCACLRWQNVSQTDKIYSRAARALVDYMNHLTRDYRDKCAVRTLTSVAYVMRHRASKEVLSFKEAKDPDGFRGKFVATNTKVSNEDLSVKLTVGPGSGTYEATLIYRSRIDKFEVDWRAVQRTNAYGNEPHCITAIDPKLNPFCYCNQQT